MSRSNPQEDARTPNPAARFYEWSGSEGLFTYYDKANKKKIEVKLPFNYLPINRCITLKGYNDDTKTSFWSNEVKDIATDKLTLQSVTTINGNKKIQVEAVGLYKDIKQKIDALGVNYVESLYIGVKSGKELELCNLQIKGAALKPWFDLCKSHNPFEIAVSVAASLDKKKGAVKYKEPVFTPITKVSKEMNDQAVELDNKLKEYLTAYFAKNAASNAVVSEDAAEPVAKASVAKQQTSKSTETVSAGNDIVDNPDIDDETAPF